MSLFGKKEQRINTYDNAEANLNSNPKSKASERISFGIVDSEDSKILNYIDEMRNGHPLVLNFENVDVPTANKVLAFIAGATYVLGGQTFKIDEKIYMFATNEDCLDGSLQEWIKDLKNN